MKVFSPDDLANLTPDEFDGILGEIKAGSRFRVFAGVGRNPEEERPDSPFYLVAPGERLWLQRLWYSLIASVFPIVFFWDGGILYMAYFWVLNMKGGRDVTDLVTSRIRKRLRLAAEAQNARDFLGDLSQRPNMNESSRNTLWENGARHQA